MRSVAFVITNYAIGGAFWTAARGNDVVCSSFEFTNSVRAKKVGFQYWCQRCQHWCLTRSRGLSSLKVRFRSQNYEGDLVSRQRPAWMVGVEASVSGVGQLASRDTS